MGRAGDYRAFLSQFFRNHRTTGALVPSGRALASALCRHVGRGGAQTILEAGPGTGAITAQIVERIRRDDRLCLVELNPEFAAHLRDAFERRPAFRAAADRCQLIEGMVQDVDGAGRFDLIVSSLPLNNFTPEVVQSVLQTYARLLKPGGTLSFFEYMLVREAKALISVRTGRARLKAVNSAIASALERREFAREAVWPNVPPAWVHHLRY